MALDLPPADIRVPPRPAIIRPAEHSILRPGYFRPVSRDERRAIIADLMRSGRLTREEAKKAFVLVPVAAWPASASAALSLTYVAGTIATGGGTGTQTLTLPTGSAEGDLMVFLGAHVGNTGNNTLPYSLTKLYTISANGANTRLYIGAKILGSSEASSDTWSVFTSVNTMGLLTFRPNISLTGFAIGGETGDTRNGADPTALSLDLSSVTEPVLKVGFYANQSSGVSHSESPSMTSRLSNSNYIAYADFYADSPVSQTSFDEGSGTNVGQALAYLTFS